MQTLILILSTLSYISTFVLFLLFVHNKRGYDLALFIQDEKVKHLEGVIEKLECTVVDIEHKLTEEGIEDDSPGMW